MLHTLLQHQCTASLPHHHSSQAKKQGEATNKTARRGSKAPTPTNTHNSISINRSWFYAEYSMTIMTHDHHQNHDLSGYYPMSPCSPLPPNQPTAFSKLQIIWICDGKSHSTLTLHHPPSSTVKTINNQHSNIWPWFLLIMVANTTAVYSSHTTPTSDFSKAKNAKESKEAIKATQPMLPSYHLPVTLPWRICPWRIFHSLKR